MEVKEVDGKFTRSEGETATPLFHEKGSRDRPLQSET